MIVKSYLLLYFSIQAGDFAKNFIDTFNLNIWFGRLSGIAVAGFVGYFIYLFLFDEINEKKAVKEMTADEIEEINHMIANKIDHVKVIKRIREYTNLDLLGAKNLYDSLVD